MRKLGKLLFLWLCLAIGASSAFAQATATAELRGKVTDPNGAVIAGATITSTDNSKGLSRTVTTNAEGSYVILSLPPSVYTLKVEASGFATKTINNVQLEVGQQLSLDVDLSLGNVGVVVDVLGNDGVLVDTERTQQSTVISSRQLNNLPINRRNFLDFALLTPGVADADNVNDSTDFRVAQTPQSGLSFGGNNGRGNSINVDGSTADTAAGGARNVISQEAVQEFQVDRNSYNAEFGGASGGVVNIVSKTGGNRINGSIFGYFRDKTFDARNAFDFNPEGKSPFNRQQFGGSLGGKIVENKTFYFVSAEGLRQKLTSFVTLNDSLAGNTFRLVPDSTTASQNQFLTYLASKPQFATTAAALRSVLTTPNARTLNLYAATNGQFPAKDTSAVISGRIDHTFSDSDTGFIRLNFAKIDNENQATGALNAVSRGRAIDNPSGGILLSENHTFDSNTVNELRAQFSYYRLKVTPNDPFGPEVNILGYGNFGRDIFLPSDSITRQFDLADTISLVRGSHTVKFGGVFQYSRISTTSETYLPGTFRFGSLPFGVFFPDPDIRTTANENPVIVQIQTDAGNGTITPQFAGFLINTLQNTTINSLQAYNANLPQVYQQGFGLPLYSSGAQKFSLFGQDTWKVRPNVTLNYGLRYSIQNEADPVPTDKNNFQPRVGISWDVFNNGKTVFRAGAGIFTGQIDNQITNVTNTLASGTNPYNINIVVSAITLPGSFGSARIYQTLLAQGVIGNRQIQASDLAQFGLITTPGRPLEARIRIGQDFQSPETYQVSGAFQQDLGGGFVAEASYLFSRGLHLVRPVDVRDYVPITSTAQAPSSSCVSVNGVFVSRFTGLPCLFATERGTFNVPGITLPGVPGTVTLPIPLPLYALDAEYQSVANTFYHAGTLQITKRFSRNYSINANYTFAKAIDEATDFNTDYLAQNPFNVRADRSLSAFDQRHRVVLSAVLTSPAKNAILKDFVFSPIFTAGSGRPFNLLIGTDTDGDSRLYNDRPATAGRNTGRGEAFYNFDMRLARRFFATERRFLELTFEAFNLFNTVNYNGINNVVGTACVANFALNPNCAGATNVIPINARGIKGVSPTAPLGFTSAAPARQLQFGIRYNF
ncbi:MAG: carboxypeptidase regulatory-like domain-containing protein [Pyrinomonadaceae bacterium]|nr:carboxypeptidase regulatory-like domain-containing protein [Pyrinomonadaceae bacterium]